MTVTAAQRSQQIIQQALGKAGNCSNAVKKRFDALAGINPESEAGQQQIAGLLTEASQLISNDMVAIVSTEMDSASKSAAVKQADSNIQGLIFAAQELLKKGNATSDEVNSKLATINSRFKREGKEATPTPMINVAAGAIKTFPTDEKIISNISTLSKTLSGEYTVKNGAGQPVSIFNPAMFPARSTTSLVEQNKFFQTSIKESMTEEGKLDPIALVNKITAPDAAVKLDQQFLSTANNSLAHHDQSKVAIQIKLMDKTGSGQTVLNELFDNGDFPFNKLNSFDSNKGLNKVALADSFVQFCDSIKDKPNRKSQLTSFVQNLEPQEQKYLARIVKSEAQKSPETKSKEDNISMLKGGAANITVCAGVLAVFSMLTGIVPLPVALLLGTGGGALMSIMNAFSNNEKQGLWDTIKGVVNSFDLDNIKDSLLKQASDGIKSYSMQ